MGYLKEDHQGFASGGVWVGGFSGGAQSEQTHIPIRVLWLLWSMAASCSKHRGKKKINGFFSASSVLANLFRQAQFFYLSGVSQLPQHTHPTDTRLPSFHLCRMVSVCCPLPDGTDVSHLKMIPNAQRSPLSSFLIDCSDILSSVCLPCSFPQPLWSLTCLALPRSVKNDICRQWCCAFRPVSSKLRKLCCGFCSNNVRIRHM